MKVTKLGHCCFIAEPKQGIRIMTDPGAFSTLQNEAQNITAVIFTHEHSDHFHLDSLKKVLANNPGVVIITNSAVGRLLTEENIPYVKVEEGESYDLHGVVIKAFGNTHEEIYADYGQVQNTGYMIDTLCYPGDSFHHPDTNVDILALPVAGPWMRMKNAIEYAKNIKPRIAFPVHDAIIQDFASFVWKVPETILKESDIAFIKLELGKEEEI
jgi:L-ascorbate metabolism protein UlaG (beta-lactamase superfamily)